ncbi:MAG: hypothetical protein R2726_13555 [Acidimicrobiales bacterium]
MPAAPSTATGPPPDNVRLLPGPGVAYCVPHTVTTEGEHTVHLRVRRAVPSPVLRLRAGDGTVVHERKLRYVVPAEMVTLKLRRGVLASVADDALHVEVEAR